MLWLRQALSLGKLGEPQRTQQVLAVRVPNQAASRSCQIILMIRLWWILWWIQHFGHTQQHQRTQGRSLGHQPQQLRGQQAGQAQGIRLMGTPQVDRLWRHLLLGPRSTTCWLNIQLTGVIKRCWIKRHCLSQIQAQHLVMQGHWARRQSLWQGVFSQLLQRVVRQAGWVCRPLQSLRETMAQQ